MDESSESGQEAVAISASPLEGASVDKLVATSLSRQRRLERLVVAISLSFVAGIVCLVFYFDTPVANGAERVINYISQSGMGKGAAVRNVVLDCLDPKNIRTPYCQERKARSDSTWKSIQRFGDSPNAFSLHEN